MPFSQEKFRKTAKVVLVILQRRKQQLGRVVQKAISANPGLKFNRLFILVCSD